MNGERKSPAPLLVKLCSDRAAFEVRLQHKISFNMDEVKYLFEAAKSHKIVVHTPYIMVLRDRKGAEVTFSKDGRMLVKSVLNEDEAEAVAQEVLRIALKASIIHKGS